MFSWDRMLNFDGETGPYVQYTHARACSVLKKAGYDKKVEKNYSIPTIFLTAKDEEDDIVKGLELGADDYVTKPFLTRELIARIKKIHAKEKNKSLIKIKDITLDLDKQEVYKTNQKINLTALEIRLLTLLFSNVGRVVKREYIIEKIWDWTRNDVNDNTVSVYIKRLREKLDTDVILTIKGIGYRVDEDEK